MDLLRAFRPSRRGVPDWLSGELTIGQMRLLFLLLEDGPRSMGQIAETFGSSLAAASGLVERTEHHGLVERQHRSDDRRIVECVLTSRGRQFFDELAGGPIDAVKRTLAVLEPHEIREFHRLLQLILTRKLGAS